MPLFGSGFDPTAPTDISPVSQGASWIRDLKAKLFAFLGVSFDLDTGALLASAIPNPVTTPYGALGSIYTSAGPGVPPTWEPNPAVQTGTILMFGGAAAPTGYLTCVGGTQLIADFPALAAVLGTTYGGDGVTTFGIPDLRGRAPVGVGTGDASDATAWSLGQKKGTEGHTLVEAEMPAHTHQTDGMTNVGSAGAGATVDGADVASLRWKYPELQASQSTGGGGAHNNLQPSIGLTFIVKT